MNEAKETHAAKRAPQQGGQEEDGLYTDSDYSSGKKRTGSDRGGNEYFGLGVAGANWSGENRAVWGAVTGGILSQLLEEAEEKLASAQACIEWYEQEKRKAEKHLENIRRLQGLTQVLPTNEKAE